MTILTRIRRFLIGYHEAPNTFGCKFCVYSDFPLHKCCTKYCLTIEPYYKCRSFSLWSKAIEIYMEIEPNE